MMFACTRKECPREVVKRRELSLEKGRLQKQEGRAQEVRERKRQLESLRHQEKVDLLHRRPCEVSSGSEDTLKAVAEKREAQVERAKQVLWRKSQLEKIRLSRLLHEQELKEAVKKILPPSKKKVDVRAKQVLENKCKLVLQQQKEAEVALVCRSHLAEARIEEIKKRQRDACEALKQKTKAAGEKALLKHKQIELMKRRLIDNEQQMKNTRANYVLGIEPAPPIKSLYKPQPKKSLPPVVPAKYCFQDKTYNLEFLRLKFAADEQKWLRRNKDFRFPTLDAITAEWKAKCSFEDPDLQFGDVQKEFANADETVGLERKYQWISEPVSVQVLQEMGLSRFVSGQEEYAALSVADKIAVSEEMRRQQREAVEREIDGRVRRWAAAERGGTAGGKLTQLEEQGVGTDKDEQTRVPDKLDYAKMLYRNVLRRWNQPLN